MQDGLIEACKSNEDWGIVGSILLAETNLNYAKDVLSGNWHFYMHMKPEFFEEMASLWIKQAEAEIRMVELQLESRP